MFWIGILVGAFLGWLCANTRYVNKLAILHKVPRFMPDDGPCGKAACQLSEFLRERRKLTKDGCYMPYPDNPNWYENWCEIKEPEIIEDLKKAATDRLTSDWQPYTSYLFNLVRLVGLTGCRIVIEEKQFNDWTGGQEEPLVVTPPLTQEQEEPQEQEESSNP